MTRRLRVRWPYEPWQCSCCGVEQQKPPPSVGGGLACGHCLDLGRRGEPWIPLSVRPLAPKVKRDERPIVAVSMRLERCALDTGEAFDLAELVDRVRERKPGELGAPGIGRDPLPDRLPPAIVITDHALDLLGRLEHSAAADSPFWQWQVSIRAQGAWRPEASAQGRSRGFLTAKPVRFGYASRRGGQKRAKARAHWYSLIDPAMFCELPGGWPELNLTDLIEFGTALRAWSNEAGLPVFAGVSSYGSRLLKDARFNPRWRRKVPAATNRRLRPLLPGNHYQLLARTDQTIARAHKYDQRSAHHHAALTSRFPDADLLDARGWFRRPAPPAGAPFDRRGPIRAGSAEWAGLLDHAGAFVIAVNVPELVAIDALTIPPLRTPGRSWQTLTSVEIQHARQLGVHLLDVWCCWTSPEDDDRLREYAFWAGHELERATGRARQWLKPLLLAAYGMLAVKPSRFRNAWRWAYRGDGAVGFDTSFGTVVGQERSARRDSEAQATNVLWRAIIESRVRLESLTFAQSLRQTGRRPIAIYADAVFTTGHGLESPPAPWAYKGTIHDLSFDSPQRYRAREELRLPGTPRGRDELRSTLPVQLQHAERR